MEELEEFGVDLGVAAARLGVAYGGGGAPAEKGGDGGVGELHQGRRCS